MDDHTRSLLIKDAERLVKDHMKAYDPSHDWFHGKLSLGVGRSIATIPAENDVLYYCGLTTL